MAVAKRSKIPDSAIQNDPRLTKCLTAKRESKSVEFKQEFLPTDPQQSLEILKDIVALANSGGGTLAIGIDNAGVATCADVVPVLEYDHAKYCDLIHKYTLQNFCDFEVVEGQKDGCKVAVFIINVPDYPLIFQRPGTFSIGNNKQQTAFGQGTIFFRHGAKSEHGTSDDLRRFIQTRLRELQDQLMRGLRKVSEAPRGSQLQVISPASGGQMPTGNVGVRLTTDKNAPGVVAIDRGVLCPYRQKEVRAELRKRLPDDLVPTTHDLTAINKVYGILSKDEFSWRPEHSSPQYSDAYVDWLVQKINDDAKFLSTTREKFYEITHPYLSSRSSTLC